MLFRLRRQHSVKVGELAPDFVLTSADGAPFRLADTRGRLVLLAFLPCSWCGTCSIRVRSYEREAEALAKFDLRTVIVSVPGAADAERFANALGLAPLVLIDEDGHVTKSFTPPPSSGHSDAPRPAAILLDRDGRILYASRCDEPDAFIEPQEIVSVLEAMARGSRPVA